MLKTFILAFVIVGLAILGMATGVLSGRRPLREGGCGNVKETGTCGVCRHEPSAKGGCHE